MFRNRILSVLGVIIVSSPLFAGTSDLPEDSNLDKVVTIGVKGEALVDLLPMLQRQTGARLRVDKEIADQKVTVFVDQKPLRELLLGIETLFRYRWSLKEAKGERTYELWLPERTRQARDAGRDAALAGAWAKAEEQIRIVASLAMKAPAEQQALMDEQYRKLTDIALFNALNRGKPMSLGGQAARLYMTMSPDVRQALKAGYTVCYDTHSDEGKWRVPDDIARSLAASLGRTTSAEHPDGTQMDSVNLRFSAQATDRELVVRVRASVSLEGGRQSQGGCSPLCDEMQITEPDIDTADHLPHVPAASTLGTKISLAPAELLEEAAVPGQSVSDPMAHLNRSDILSLLHRKLGLQIISDHYSDWSWVCPSGETPVASWLDGVRQHQPSAIWGYDGRYVYVRSANPRHLDAGEPPNRLLRPLQGAFKRQGWLGITELAQIAAMREDQIRCVSDSAHFLGLASDKNLAIGAPWNTWGGLSTWVLALRFYGCLSDAQREQAMAKGIATACLNPGQRAILADCLINGSFPGRVGSDWFNSPVGIWRNGLRVDKPDASQPFDPISVEIHQERDQFCFRSSGESSETFSASTVDAAWEKITKSHPGTKKGSGSLCRRIGCTIRFRFSDGTFAEVPIPVDVPAQRP